MTLRLHLPHHLLPADQCAEHGPQEYGPAAGKGHTDERADSAHTEHAVTNQIQFECVRVSLLKSIGGHPRTARRDEGALRYVS